MARKKKSRQGARIYWRERGEIRRAYADFRSLGAGQEALIPAAEVGSGGSGVRSPLDR